MTQCFITVVVAASAVAFAAPLFAAAPAPAASAVDDESQRQHEHLTSHHHHSLPTTTTTTTTNNNNLNAHQVSKLEPWEQEMLLERHPGWFDEYRQRCFNFGVSIMFVVALPAAPFITLFFTALRLRLVAFKVRLLVDGFCQSLWWTVDSF
jgi:hypothetical protein